MHDFTRHPYATFEDACAAQRERATNTDDPMPDPLKYSDPIVFAIEFHAWQLRTGRAGYRLARDRRAMFDTTRRAYDYNLNQTAAAFYGPGEGENR